MTKSKQTQPQRPSLLEEIMADPTKSKIWLDRLPAEIRQQVLELRGWYQSQPHHDRSVTELYLSLKEKLIARGVSIGANCDTFRRWMKEPHNATQITKATSEESQVNSCRGDSGRHKGRVRYG